MAITNELFQKVVKNDAVLVFQDKPRQEHRFLESIALTSILSNLAAKAEGDFFRRELVDEVLEKHNGLRAILALNGFSKATLRKIVHLARVCDDKALRKLLNYKDWNIDKVDDTGKVWESERIERLVQENAAFRAGIVNLFYEGITLSILHDHFPPRAMKKLTIERMGFQPFSLIETLVEYGLYYEHTQSISDSLTTLGKQLEN